MITVHGRTVGASPETIGANACRLKIRRLRLYESDFPLLAIVAKGPDDSALGGLCPLVGP